MSDDLCAGLPRADALVIGGGLAGAGVGLLLARAGRGVTLLEKSSAGHHKVCGEFLSREAVFYLERLGVNLAGLGAVPISRVRLAAGSRIAEADLPFPALSLTRRALDEALLSCAARAGVKVLRGCRVERLTRSEAGWMAQADGAAELKGDAVFLATGKHDLHGRARPATRHSELVAFKMYFRLHPSQCAAIAGCVELILFPGGYAGLQPVEDGLANLCLLVTRSRLKQCGGTWSSLLEHITGFSEHLSTRLGGAEAVLEKPLALSAIPYGLLRGPSLDGVWQLGDQAAVIPSFSGDGMSIALHSAHLAASIYLQGGSAASFQAQLRGELKRPVRVATSLSRLMIAAPQLAQALRLWPSLLSRIASGTRVPTHALLEL